MCQRRKDNFLQYYNIGNIKHSVHQMVPGLNTKISGQTLYLRSVPLSTAYLHQIDILELMWEPAQQNSFCWCSGSLLVQTQHAGPSCHIYLLIHHTYLLIHHIYLLIHHIYLLIHHIYLLILLCFCTPWGNSFFFNVNFYRF